MINEQTINVTFTTILHDVRNNLGLTNNEYVLCNTVYHLSNNPKAPIQGWCNASKETLSVYIGVSKQSIHSLINKMIEKDLIEKDEKTKQLKTTKKWYDYAIVKISDSKESLPLEPVDSKESLLVESRKFTPRVKKVYSKSKESLLNNNSDNNIYNNIYNNTNEQDESCRKNKTQEILNLFYENLNPNLKFENKTLRKDAEFLVNHYPLEKLEAMILYVKKNQGKQYFPTIATPTQLREKMAAVISYKNREKNKKSKIIKI